jgi:hypothetical protein
VEDTRGLVRLGGAVLAGGAVLGIAAGMTHPQGSGDTFRTGFTEMLRDPMWATSHWAALVAFVVMAWGLWLLLDGGWTGGSALGRAGARLALIGTLLLAVQTGLELVAPSDLEAYAAGRPTPLIDAMEVLQVVAWPAHGIGWALVAIALPWSTPRWVRAFGVAGGIAFTLAGILVEGLHIVELGVLFAFGGALHLWLAWVGIQAARSTAPAVEHSREPVGTP